MTDTVLPAILLEKNILIPIKIDITYNGARVVDTFCWNLYNSYLSPEEFADRTCLDLNLPNGFRHKITMQIEEQVAAFDEIVKLIFTFSKVIPNWSEKMQEIQTISVGIRHNCIDYSDKIQWDPLSTSTTPESFAENTCKDNGLPFEMEAAIAHKIRETLFRWLINILENPKLCEKILITPEVEKFSELRLTLVPPNQAVDMATNLWKRAKPNTLEESAAIPQPMLPADKDTNANIWKA
jgi:hypothetical protein